VVFLLIALGNIMKKFFRIFFLKINLEISLKRSCLGKFLCVFLVSAFTIMTCVEKAVAGWEWTYIVRRGDTLSEIVERETDLGSWYNQGVQTEIRRLNPNIDFRKIWPGQQILLPEKRVNREKREAEERRKQEEQKKQEEECRKQERYLADVCAKISEREGHLGWLNQEIAWREGRTREIEAQTLETQKYLDSINTEIEKMEYQLQEKLNEEKTQEERKDSLERKKFELGDYLNRIQIQETELTETIRRFNDELIELNKVEEKLRESTDELSGKVYKQKERIDQNELIIRELQSKLDTLLESTVAKEKRLKELSSQNKEKHQKVDLVDIKIRNEDLRIQSLETMLAEISCEKARISTIKKKEILELKQQIAEFNEKVAQDFRNLKEKISVAEVRLQEATSEKMILRDHFENLQEILGVVV
jgi:chromosome segregation ATPase